MIVVNITKGKLEELEEFNLMNEGSLAMIGAKIEKNPKLIAWLITVADSCSHCSSVYVSSLISLIPKLMINWIIWLIVKVKVTKTMVSTIG